MKIDKMNGKVLLTNGKIIDPVGEKIYDSDILIENGVIVKIEKGMTPMNDAEIINLTGQMISPGFVDIHVHFREPGFEDKETIESGCQAALAGGFTKVCCMPNTEPPIDTQESVRFIYRKAEGQIVDVYPIAAITKNRKGEELTGMVELSSAGAVAFSDDGNPLVNAQIMRFALEYSKIVDKPIINHSEDPALKADGYMNEGIVSTQLGIPGNPSVAEEIMIYRDLALTKFTNSRLHVPHVSTKTSVALIRQAKADGVRVTAEVTPHHFSLTDEYMRSFDANGKVSPPLRSESDRLALIEGIQDGTIDAIATDHAPHQYDTKETSLDLASSGMIGLESAFGLAMTHLVHAGYISLMDLIKLLTIKPAHVMNLPLPGISIGAEANLTIIDPDEWWVFSRKDIYSRSQNTPFIGRELTGRVKSVFAKSSYVRLQD
ncbi:MAG: dihydroorotase [Candidatus Marinimicrobia bacterium CG08_land_8_20_14_0_20_45_22]|nr:MAG: dihydroorotase [Candidatus Marinimicrobia bacterium CG08_land_8_20_14_0_20_45_22]